VSARAGIVVTGTEVLTGRVVDRNGPWLAERLLELGVELAHNVIVGDRPADVEAALGWLGSYGVDLIVTSGGLGPTEDDLTAEVVGRFQGREMVLDEATEAKIADNAEIAAVAPNPAPKPNRSTSPLAANGPTIAPTSPTIW
jgi:nicotinamide-nucleotide amidase